MLIRLNVLFKSTKSFGWLVTSKLNCQLWKALINCEKGVQQKYKKFLIFFWSLFVVMYVRTSCYICSFWFSLGIHSAVTNWKSRQYSEMKEYSMKWIWWRQTEKVDNILENIISLYLEILFRIRIINIGHNTLKYHSINIFDIFLLIFWIASRKTSTHVVLTFHQPS